MEIIHNNYEFVLLSPPNLGEDQIKLSFEKLTSTISRLGGTVLVEEPWGSIKMAYEINRHRYAKYFLIDYVGPAELPLELERLVRIDSTFMRFLTVKVSENVSDIESCKEQALAKSTRRQEKINELKH